MLTIELNMYHAVALGAFLFWLGGVHVSYPAEEIDTMGNMFLSIFLAMALAGLKLWELIDLAMPMVGGMFIDFFNAVLIAANIGWWT